MMSVRGQKKQQHVTHTRAVICDMYRIGMKGWDIFQGEEKISLSDVKYGVIGTIVDHPNFPLNNSAQN